VHFKNGSEFGDSKEDSDQIRLYKSPQDLFGMLGQ